ncbi:unnamed protein product [Closterium sp. NIES-65]|nr:unnamed protein product [Closterium sp. NIES-65]
MSHNALAALLLSLTDPAVVTPPPVVTLPVLPRPADGDKGPLHDSVSDRQVFHAFTARISFRRYYFRTTSSAQFRPAQRYYAYPPLPRAIFPPTMELRSGAILPGPVPVPITAAEQHADGWFREGVRLVFARWTALQLAVENQWGGGRSAEKAQHMQADLVHFCYSKRGAVYGDELEEWLDEATVRDFNMEVEDGSLREVADKVVEVFKACRDGSFTLVQQLQAEEAAAAAKGRRSALQQSKAANRNADSDDSDSDVEEVGNGGAMDEDAPGRGAGMGASCSGSRRAAKETPPEPLLTQEEVADGWEVAPTRRSRRLSKGPGNV